MSDTLDTSKKGRGEAAIAMMEANLVPGVAHITLRDEKDTLKLVEAVKPGVSLIAYRIPRELAESGVVGGMACASVMAELPKETHGKVSLAFDGWADDPRELYTIPQVVCFCQGLLLGAPHQPSFAQANVIMDILVDEEKWAFRKGELINAHVLETPGGLWLIGCAFPDQVYVRNTRSKTGYVRDIGRSIEMRLFLRAKGSGSPLPA